MDEINIIQIKNKTMTRKIKCETTRENKNHSVKVKVIKAPFVDSIQLRSIIYNRARALVL